MKERKLWNPSQDWKLNESELRTGTEVVLGQVVIYVCVAQILNFILCKHWIEVEFVVFYVQ